MATKAPQATEVILPQRKAGQKSTSATKTIDGFWLTTNPHFTMTKRWFQADHKPLQSGFKITMKFQMPLKNLTFDSTFWSFWVHTMTITTTGLAYNMLGSLFHKPH